MKTDNFVHTSSCCCHYSLKPCDCGAIKNMNTNGFVHAHFCSFPSKPCCCHSIETEFDKMGRDFIEGKPAKSKHSSTCAKLAHSQLECDCGEDAITSLFSETPYPDVVPNKGACQMSQTQMANPDAMYGLTHAEVKCNENKNEAAYVKCCNDIAKHITTISQVPGILSALDEYKRTVGKELALMELDGMSKQMEIDKLMKEISVLKLEKENLSSKLFGTSTRLAEINRIVNAVFP